jgi:hypothetical protein
MRIPFHFDNKTSVYLTALGFGEEDTVIKTLREHYSDTFTYPHPQAEQIHARMYSLVISQLRKKQNT